MTRYHYNLARKVLIKRDAAELDQVYSQDMERASKKIDKLVVDIAGNVWKLIRGRWFIIRGIRKEEDGGGLVLKPVNTVRLDA